MYSKSFIFTAIMFSFSFGMEESTDLFRSHENPLLRGYHPPQTDVMEHQMSKLLRKMSTRTLGREQQENRDVITELPLIKNWLGSEVCDQGNQGSCTANSAHFFVKYLSFFNAKNQNSLVKNPDILRISRAYQYYVTRFYEGTIQGCKDYMVNSDTGGSITGSLLALDKFGCCPENVSMDEERIGSLDLSGRFVYKGFPYNDRIWNVPPDPESSRIAHEKSWSGISEGSEYGTHDVRENPYAAVSTSIHYHDLASKYRDQIATKENMDSFVNSVIRALKNNHPIAAGMMLDDTFLKDNKGYIPMPDLKKFKATGGHAFSVVGYGPYNQKAPEKRYFKFINSWGDKWGDNGFGYLEEDHFAHVNKFSVEAFEVSYMPEHN